MYSSKFVRLFHHRSFTLYGNYINTCTNSVVYYLNIRIYTCIHTSIRIYIYIYIYIYTRSYTVSQLHIEQKPIITYHMVTKKTMHTIIFQLKTALSFSFLVTVQQLATKLFICSSNQLSFYISQCMYSTPTFITERLHLVAYVQVF